jgi:hypothetical protein
MMDGKRHCPNCSELSGPKGFICYNGGEMIPKIEMHLGILRELSSKSARHQRSTYKTS